MMILDEGFELLLLGLPATVYANLLAIAGTTARLKALVGDILAIHRPEIRQGSWTMKSTPIRCLEIAVPTLLLEELERRGQDYAYFLLEDWLKTQEYEQPDPGYRDTGTGI